MRCEPTVKREFAKVTKMADRGKASFLFGSILYMSTEKSDLLVYLGNQNTNATYHINVKVAARDLFDVSIGMNHGKYSSYSLNAVFCGKRVIYHGKKSSVYLRERISWKRKPKHVSPVTVFSSVV